MTVRQLLENLDSLELTEWRAYLQIVQEEQEKTMSEAQAKRDGKVTAKDPKMLSEALKAQLAVKKGK